MAKIIRNLNLGLDEDLEEKLRLLEPNLGSFRVLRQSVDARRRHSVHFVYTVEVADQGESFTPRKFEVERLPSPPKEKPLIVGSGPAGLFAALRLIERGIPCILFERGSRAEERIKGINRFWRHGELHPENNVCFGEGGAGLFSDGKLITRIKSPHIPYVLNRLVQFGAPPEIEYVSNPHVGSDRIRRLIPRLRDHLLKNGCEIRFDTPVAGLLTEGKSVRGVRTRSGEEVRGSFVVLATGHSAEDMLRHLAELDVHLEGKSFAVGLRIEHPQPLVNRLQYRQWADHPKLGAANYRLANTDPESGIGVYSFCMCPGGYILSSGTEPDGVVCNGMSNYRRNSPYANAAIVVTIDHQKRFGSGIFQGLDFRRELEKGAYQAVHAAGGSKELPAQKVNDFWAGRVTDALPHSSPSGARAVALHELFPEWINRELKSSLEKFNRQLPGFLSEEAQFFAVESRTSCPVRVTRDNETLESLSHRGLFPCGEGAGYAGGITSAACDGIRVAERIYAQLSSVKVAADDGH